MCARARVRVHYGGATCQLPAKARSKSPGERQRLGRTVSEAVRRAGSAAFAQRLPVPVDTPEDPRAEGTSPPTRSGVGRLQGQGRACHVERSPDVGWGTQGGLLAVVQRSPVARPEASKNVNSHCQHASPRRPKDQFRQRRISPREGQTSRVLRHAKSSAKKNRNCSPLVLEVSAEARVTGTQRRKHTVS